MGSLPEAKRIVERGGIYFHRIMRGTVNPKLWGDACSSEFVGGRTETTHSGHRGPFQATWRDEKLHSIKKKFFSATSGGKPRSLRKAAGKRGVTEAGVGFLDGSAGYVATGKRQSRSRSRGCTAMLVQK